MSYANVNWRTINIDALDPDSAANFDLSTLTPALAPVSTSDVQSLAGQIRQLLRGGDSEGALRGALENAPYGADERGKVRNIVSHSSHLGMDLLDVVRICPRHSHKTNAMTGGSARTCCSEDHRRRTNWRFVRICRRYSLRQ